MNCLNTSTGYKQSSDLLLNLAICGLVTHKNWRRKESILGALGKLLREVLFFKIYLISFSTATNQYNCTSGIRI